MLKKWRLFCLISLIGITQILQSTTSFSQNKEFKVFDAIMIKNKPNLYNKGFSKINMIYEDSLLNNHPKFPSDFNSRVVNQNKVQSSFKRIDSKYPICIDVESWLLKGQFLNSSVKKYSKLLSQFRAKFPASELGYYGVLPFADLNIYQAKATFLKNNKNKNWLGEWEYINNNLGDLGDISSVAFPSCYTRYKDRALWLTAFKMQIEKVKKINPKLKIYAFVWPQYYSPGFGYNEQYIEGDFWRYQLEEIYKLCDGVVIWAPPIHSSNRKGIYWDDSQEWFKETISFIKQKKIISNYK